MISKSHLTFEKNVLTGGTLYYAYEIYGNNFVRLRDVGNALDFWIVLVL